MKDFLKKFLVFVGILAAVGGTCSLTNAEPVQAACRDFLGMTSWDCHVGAWDNEDNLVNNIATIASNILTDATVVASYLVLGYVIWGGYLYMFSSGDAGKAAAAKKTLSHAFIGLAIVISAYAIFSGIRMALIGSKSLADCTLSAAGCTTPANIVVNAIQWVGGMGGVVSAIFIVVGAWGYMTAAGDPGKLQKAKTTIMYALIGLVVVALAEVITGFVAGVVRDANAYIDNSQQIIANINKENI